MGTGRFWEGDSGDRGRAYEREGREIYGLLREAWEQAVSEVLLNDVVERYRPSIYSDGYVALMPGEKRVITTEVRDADTRGEKPRIVVEGFNLLSAEN
jgi:hypothetical protein